MTKKTKSKEFGIFTRRSFEPFKMTVAISAAAGTAILLLAMMTIG